MAISKVIYKSSASAQGVTWIDATPATAAAADIISPKTAMLADGVVTQGTGSGGVTPTGNINITQAGVTDVTNYATATVPAASFWTQAVDMGFTTVSNQRVWRMKGITELDPGEGDVEGWISSGTYAGNVQSYNAVPANTTITPSTSAQTVGGAKYMMEGAVTVAAMPSGTAGTPTATKGAVVNNSVTITPSVTNTTGYITGGTKTGTAVTVSASELVSGSETKTENGTYDVTNLASLIVNVASGSSKNVQVIQSTSRTTATSLTKTSGEITVSKTGTYDVYWSGCRTNTSSSYTWGTRLYIGSTAYGTENTTWSNNCQSNHLTNVSLTENQKISVYARGRGGSYYAMVPMLLIIES